MITRYLRTSWTSTCLEISKREINTGGVSFWPLRLGFWEFLLELKWWYTVQWFKSPHNEKEEVLLSRYLVAKYCDSTEEVMGQCSHGIVLVRCSLGTVQSKDSGLGTVQSWDSTVLGQ